MMGGPFFLCFCFCFVLFVFHFSKPLKKILGLPKWKFSTGKKHFTPGKKSGKMTLPPQKNFPVTPLDILKIAEGTANSQDCILCNNIFGFKPFHSFIFFILHHLYYCYRCSTVTNSYLAKDKIMNWTMLHLLIFSML